MTFLQTFGRHIESSWEAAPGERKHGGGIIQEKSWGTRHRRGRIMDGESSTRKYGGGIIRSNHEEGIVQDKQWSTHHGAEIMEEESSRKGGR